MLNLFKRIYVTVFPEAWCCAVRFNNDINNCILNDKTSEFICLNDTKRFWTADPFLFEKDSQIYLFFEAFDRLKRKGVLGYRTINENNIGDIKIFYESDSHLSYPFIYEEDEEVYIIPESNKSGELYRLKCEHFPNKWVKERVLLNEKLADTTRLKKDNHIYYLTEKVDDSNTFDRLDLYYELNEHLIECANNPVKLDASNARCAGKLFEHNNEIIRPSQNCGKAYGEELNFNRMKSISSDGYEEELIERITLNDINIDSKKTFTGIHTYNKVKNVEVIDLKFKRQFNILNFLGIFYKLFKKVL